VKRVAVKSSTISAIGYDPRRRILEIVFRDSGEVYRYFDVPAEEYTAFLKADSKGTYLNQHFKKQGYRYIEIGIRFA
jgi:KTSC domain